MYTSDGFGFLSLEKYDILWFAQFLAWQVIGAIALIFWAALNTFVALIILRLFGQMRESEFLEHKGTFLLSQSNSPTHSLFDLPLFSLIIKIKIQIVIQSSDAGLHLILIFIL